MFIYRIAKTNRLICGWTDVDVSLIWGRLRGVNNMASHINTIINDIQNRIYELKQTDLLTNVEYFINSYSIPSGRSFNVNEREEVLRDIIDDLSFSCRCIEEIAPTLGLVNAVLKSYIKPFQPVTYDTNNCLDPEHLEYYHNRRTEYETLVNQMSRRRNS